MENLAITGGSGFIGSNLIRFILNETSFSGRIINLDSLTYAANPFSLDDIARDHKNRYFFEKIDITSRKEIDRVFEEYQIDALCHLAAESHVDRSIAKPGQFIETNIIGTFNLLESCRMHATTFKRFHHVSTDEVFGSLGPSGFFTEDTPYKPNSPYSASKASSDHLVRAYKETYKLPVTISNCSNNYGPYQFPEKLIPLMILNALEGKPLPVYGDGMNVRDWLYVADHCSAIWKILIEGEMGETYNVGGRNEMTNLAVVQQICDLVDELAKPLEQGPRCNLISFVADRPGHDRRYAIDCSRIEQKLSWVPQESFESGIRKTVLWYLENTAWINQVRTGEYREWIQKNYLSRACNS